MLEYMAHKLFEKYSKYDGTYESMRQIRKYLSLVLNSNTNGKTNIGIFTKEHPVKMFDIMAVMSEHKQDIVGKEDGIYFVNDAGKLFPPIKVEDIPEQSIMTMIRHRLEFPELDKYK